MRAQEIAGGQVDDPELGHQAGALRRERVEWNEGWREALPGSARARARDPHPLSLSLRPRPPSLSPLSLVEIGSLRFFLTCVPLPDPGPPRTKTTVRVAAGVAPPTPARERSIGAAVVAVVADDGFVVLRKEGG